MMLLTLSGASLCLLLLTCANLANLLLGVLAVAIVLCAVGIYGLLAYTVLQRAQEIGVRLALGAEPARVGRMILADSMRLAVIGIVPGALGASVAGRP